MEDGRFTEHIRRMRRLYRDRRDALRDALERYCGDVVTPQQTDAGMHMLVWLKDGIDDDAAHRALLEAGIESLPLSVYCDEVQMRPAVVLGFSGVDEREMSNLAVRMRVPIGDLPDRR